MMRNLTIAVFCLTLMLCEATVRRQADTIDAVRLVEGLTEQEGRVEIHVGDRWGTVCDDEFDDLAAKVVCRMAGQPTEGARAVGNAAFGESNRHIILDDVRCSGDEPDLNSCTHLPIGVHDCFHEQEVGVVCGSIPIDNVRLVHGSRPQEGRLEVQIGSIWGTVCDDYFTEHAAQVACRMLNFSTDHATPVGTSFFGRGEGQILLDDVFCSGDELSLADCRHNHYGFHDCDHYEDVGVVCDGLRLENVRLVNGAHPQEGRLEVQILGRWGTVCHVGFHDPTAQVACRMLNFPTENATLVSSDMFGEGDGPILMENVFCNGDESSLEDCSYSMIHSCEHDEDVGVICA